MKKLLAIKNKKGDKLVIKSGGKKLPAVQKRMFKRKNLA